VLASFPALSTPFLCNQHLHSTLKVKHNKTSVNHFTGCGMSEAEISKRQDSGISWPEAFLPATHPKYVFVHNEIDIDASADKIFSWLTRGTTWASFYDNAKGFHTTSDSTGVLALDTKFNWTTFGVNIDSQVLICEVDRQIMWNGKMTGLDVVHAWRLYPNEDNTRTHVVTEEIQTGFLCQLSDFFFPHRMYTKHQEWLTGLKKVSETIGYAPQPQETKT